ncbi:uncharacterized protein BXZ73DRAFT_106702 [Epithele typhae]|uniref:uncharacterized protein n=1 Tax=Epithele typhae TaxID=378194 RepID=UPI002008972C|nr:uncharacterized protein BXZ73DRAFT_106702 [Epithele typhae]KAH9914056.1 hypothetical protein BXZ73DRAFT_106702 [Epithele typhae]
MTNHWSRLRSMSIAIKRDNPYEQDSVVPLSGMLQTLSALSTLADLTITLHLKCPRISLSSEDIQAAVSAWPALESLRLYTNLELAPVTSNLPEGSARVTIDALAHFARGCLELRPEDATVLSANVDEEDLTKGTTCTQRTLKELVLGGVVSSCQDWLAVRESVLRYASELFPVANVYLDSHAPPLETRKQPANAPQTVRVLHGTAAAANKSSRRRSAPSLYRTRLLFPFSEHSGIHRQ